MKRTEKTDKILAKYKQYLKLEKSLSTNTVEAYLTDLDKLMAYLTLENLHPLEVTLEHLETFSAGLRDIGVHKHVSCRASGLFITFSCSKIISRPTRPSCLSLRK